MGSFILFYILSKKIINALLYTSIKTFYCDFISFTSLVGLQSQMRIYLNQDLLNYKFITEFTDAEGLFIILITKNSKFKIGWRIEARLLNSFHNKDLILLQLIKNYFNGIGNFNKEWINSVQYQVTTLQDLTNVIIPHFNKFPLITKKKLANFELFKITIEIINDKTSSIDEYPNNNNTLLVFLAI